MEYLVLAVGFNGRNVRSSLITKVWTVDGEKMLSQSGSGVIGKLLIASSRSHVLVRIRVDKPDVAILAFRMIEKMLGMIL